jgi:membrane protease YdiL (CAAX protease family)
LFPGEATSFADEWLYWTVYEVVVAGVALGLMWISGEPWSVFGIKKPRWSMDLITTFFVASAVLATSLVGIDLLQAILLEFLSPDRVKALSAYDAWDYPPKGLPGVLAIAICSLAIGFSEELVMRGYLISRLQQLVQSKTTSVIISAALFGLFHANDGVLSVGVTTLVGLVFGVAFVVTKRIWPLVFAHAFVDFNVFLFELS